MNTLDKVKSAIQDVVNGLPTRYINVEDKVIRVSNHGANPERVDANTISLVVDNDGQSYRSDRGRIVTNWERSNQFYIDNDGNFSEQFESIESLLEWFEIA